MPLDPALRTAYERAVYVIYGSPPVQFRVGEASDVLQAMLAMSHVERAAFVSSATSPEEAARSPTRKMRS